ncbi:MAG: sigma-70 family RNA polymerase sigma factor [Deltaproteobacteria bacterium]|nr:sigma-70 family RNA polymerase sigma factor [Deltaproteobacteria bacterium]
MGTIARPTDTLAHDVSSRLAGSHDSALESRLASALADASGVYQDFVPTAQALVQQLRACLQDRERSEWSEHLVTLNAADIWLCAALADGDDDAVRVFEQRLGPQLERTLRRFSLSEDQRTELAQHIRVQLLVPSPQGPARIALYRGWGSLEGWTRTVAARLALNAIRDGKGTKPLERAPELIGASPEFAALKASRRSLFMQALGEAFHSLGPRERALLRLRYLEGVQANALAGSYDVHESTMSRWLASARTELQARFEANARPLVNDDEAIAELVGAMQSRFGESLQELFVSELAESTEPSVQAAQAASPSRSRGAG